MAVVPTVRVKMVEGGGGGGGGGEVDSQLEYLQDQLKQGRMHYAPTYLSQYSCNRVGGDKGKVTFKKVKTMLDEVMEYHAGVGMCGCETVEVECMEDVEGIVGVVESFYDREV